MITEAFVTHAQQLCLLCLCPTSSPEAAALLITLSQQCCSLLAPNFHKLKKAKTLDVNTPLK